MATAWQAMRLGAVLYIVPFMFVYSPSLLMIGTWPGILYSAATAGLGIFCLAAALQGWLRSRATVLDRALLLVAAGLFIVPQATVDVVALALLGTVWTLQTMRRVPEVAPAPAAPLG
jgi:TRAP-type uncharacterized transport system fused permease subunit